MAEEKTRQGRSTASIPLRNPARQVRTLAGYLGLGRGHCPILLAHALAAAIRDRDTVYLVAANRNEGEPHAAAAVPCG